jgi:hypothetical protein
MEVGVQLHIVTVLPQLNRPLYKQDTNLGEAQSQYRRCIKEKNTLPLLGTKPQFLYHLA